MLELLAATGAAVGGRHRRRCNPVSRSSWRSLSDDGSSSTTRFVLCPAASLARRRSRLYSRLSSGTVLSSTTASKRNALPTGQSPDKRDSRETQSAFDEESQSSEVGRVGTPGSAWMRRCTAARMVAHHRSERAVLATKASSSTLMREKMEHSESMLAMRTAGILAPGPRMPFTIARASGSHDPPIPPRRLHPQTRFQDGGPQQAGCWDRFL